LLGSGYIYLRSKAREYVAAQQPAEVNPLIATAEIGKEYEVKSLKANGDEDTLTMRLVSAELRKEVIIKGQPATAKNDKAFAVFNLEVDNEDAESEYLKPVNLFRLVGEDGKKYAADIHSDVIEVQPISTKVTRIGFVVKESDRQLQLLVGELEGDKDTVDVQFN